MIKLVLFDLDNTLIDFMRMKRLSCEAGMEAMIDSGLKIKKEKGLKILFFLYSKYGIEHQRIFQVFLKTVLGKVDYKIMGAGIAAYRKVKEGLLYPYPGVLPTLKALKKKYKLGIVSDAPRIQAWTRLAAMNIHKEFDFVLTFEDTGHKKSTRLPFKAALKKTKLKPEEVMVIGDSEKRDIVPAKKLGMRTVLAKYGCLEKTKGKADFEINNIRELLKIL